MGTKAERYPAWTVRERAAQEPLAWRQSKRFSDVTGLWVT
jgi:hypothetical protein